MLIWKLISAIYGVWYRRSTATCRKYNLAPSLYARWKKKYLAKGLKV